MDFEQSLALDAVEDAHIKLDVICDMSKLAYKFIGKFYDFKFGELSAKEFFLKEMALHYDIALNNLEQNAIQFIKKALPLED